MMGQLEVVFHHLLADIEAVLQYEGIFDTA